MFLNEETSRNRSQPKHHTSWIEKIWPNKTQKQWILFLIFVLFLLVKLTAFQKLDLNKMVESNNHTCLNRYCASKFAIYIHCERQMNVQDRKSKKLSDDQSKSMKYKLQKIWIKDSRTYCNEEPQDHCGKPSQLHGQRIAGQLHNGVYLHDHFKKKLMQSINYEHKFSFSLGTQLSFWVGQEALCVSSFPCFRTIKC